MKAAITMLALVLSVGLTHASEYTCQVRWVPAGNAEVMVSGLFVKIGDRTITEITASALSDDHEDNWTIIFEEGKHSHPIGVALQGHDGG